jgi:hypothetical protein
MNRAYYSDSITGFLAASDQAILGFLAEAGSHALEPTQRDAWVKQIRVLKEVLSPYRGRGKLYFEYSIPRLGRRIDVLAVVGHVLFILEFKAGEKHFAGHARDQVWDYALDLQNFHETSHNLAIAPILIATRAEDPIACPSVTASNERLLAPMNATPATLGSLMEAVLRFTDGAAIDAETWERGRYSPTPTIIEAATALYRGHSVEEISRSDASAVNLADTSQAVEAIIADASRRSRKAICFVTGVPGAGKTLVGLNIATRHFDKASELYSVFLSGNGPLVNILREALARDKVRQMREQGEKQSLTRARSEVQAFIQNVHHFRDDCLADPGPPIEHVALFDEAQRAWTLAQTADFMRRKKGRASFEMSEPEFLISCLDRHDDWAVVVCLVGGGQEINRGEAGISEWIDALERSFPDWDVHISSRLHDSEYGAGDVLRRIEHRPNVTIRDELHLSVSMRSFRAENVSLLVKQLLDLDEAGSRRTLEELSDRYPIVLTRDLTQARDWLRSKARGSERYGIVVSSQAQRLKPLAIDVRAKIDPVHWFLHPKSDVRSSYYLEDAATEFDVQGLELDWACVTWDGDFRHNGSEWEHWGFKGAKWKRVRSEQRQVYLKNAYRVLLTRARQGMVIVVPEGEARDHTRKAEYYDETFSYLRGVGLETI